MPKTRTAFLACFAALSLAGAPAGAMTVADVIAKHVEAHGGQQAWRSIQTMKITGSFTAFSKTAPFTMHRKRDTKYHIDHVLDDKRVVIGFDGEIAWWDNPWRQTGVRAIEGPDLAVLMRNVEFETPLFDYEAKGHTVGLLGTVDLDGVETLGIELTRADESVETWYLDPRTYLAVGRESPGSDFGRPMPQRTFFDDYREVGGAMIAHFSETQWYTRHRVMVIENIEVNRDIDDALFVMPPLPGMGPLQPLSGSWQVAVSQRNQPGAPWQETERASTIEPLVGGTLLQERYTTERGNEVVWTLSYDRFQEHYRLTQINDVRGLLDVEEGDFDENGRLVVTNLDTGTTWEGFGFTFHTRVSIFDITDDAFEMEYEISTDGGENWFLAAKSSYARSEE
jgi:hypothetical protein